MISSACAISRPLEPDTGEDQSGAADSGHPQKEVLLQKKEPGQRQRRNRYSCSDVSWPPPNAGDHVGGRNAERYQGGLLPRIDRPQDEKNSREKCNQRQGDGAVAPTHLVACTAERRKSRDQSDRHNSAPDHARVGRKEVLQAVADDPKNSPQQKLGRTARIAMQLRAARLRRFDIAESPGSV